MENMVSDGLWAVRQRRTGQLGDDLRGNTMKWFAGESGLKQTLKTLKLNYAFEKLYVHFEFQANSDYVSV